MTKYKVGDYVKIKDNLIEDKAYSTHIYSFRYGMDEFLGKIVKLTDGILNGGFHIQFGRNIGWTIEMFERKASEEEKKKYIMKEVINEI